MSGSSSSSSSCVGSGAEQQQCASPWAALLQWQVPQSSRDIPLILLLTVSFFLVVEKLNQWHVFYQIKLFFEYLLYPVPLVDVELTSAETDDDGVPTEPTAAAKVQLMDSTKPGFIQCFDPATNQFLGQVKAMTAQDVHELCVKAATAQK